MAFNYEQSIWGKGEASLRWSDPASFRLHQAAQMLESVPDASNVLELGCGAGQFIRAIKRLRVELNCFGCDISREAIALAEERHDGVKYAASEENRLPYADASMHAVLIFDVLEHVENPEIILNEVHRVLKPGGIFYSFVPCEGDALSLWNVLRKIRVWGDLTKKYAGHINYFSRKKLVDLFKEKKFEIVKINYSEHLLGQLLGIAAFVAMNRAARRSGTQQLNNETYFTSQTGGVLNLLKKLVNGLVYIESGFLRWLPSPNVHLVVRKK